MAATMAALLSASTHNYGNVFYVSSFHHRGTEGTEGFYFLPIGRRRWAKRTCSCEKKISLCDSVVNIDFHFPAKLVLYVIVFMNMCTKVRFGNVIWIKSGYKFALSAGT